MSYKNTADDEARDVIQRAIHAMFAQTCIKFDPAQVGDDSIIRFSNSSKCSSFIGRKEIGISTVKYLLFRIFTFFFHLALMVKSLGIFAICWKTYCVFTHLFVI